MADDEKRDEVLKRMLKTPPKPHDSDKPKPDEKPKGGLIIDITAPSKPETEH